MLILNKKKYFNNIYFEIFKKSMLSIDDTNNLLTYYGAKPYIEEDKMKFVLSTFLFNLFFLEGVLQQKYWTKYKEEIIQIIEAMIDEISKRTSYENGKIYDVYDTIRKNLSDAALNNDRYKDINPLYIAAIYYLQFTFHDDYTEKIGYDDGEVETAISKLFQTLINNTQTYLHSL